MVAHGHTAAASTVPGVDEAAAAARLSGLLDTKNGLNLLAVEATADRNIVVASNGRRYRLESISDADSAPNAAHVVTPPPTVSSAPPETRPSAAQTFGSLLRNSLKRRPGSNASSHSFSFSRSGRSASSPQITSPVAPSEPEVAPHEITNKMAQLNVNRFSETPLFWHSDGGVQAAEALTDPHTPRAAPSPTSPVSPTTHAAQLPSPQSPEPSPQYSSYDAYHASGLNNHIGNFNYVNYTEQANYHVQQSRQPTGPTSTGFPSLMEYSNPLPPSRRGSDLYPPINGLYGDTEKEYFEPQYDPTAIPPPSAVVSTPNLAERHGDYIAIGRSYSSGDVYDTVTPIVVVDEPTFSHAPSHSSDGASTSRDNVLPGEIMLYDGPVKSAQTLNSPDFQDGQLKVFRNTLSNDVRFHCRVGRESETYWIKSMNAQLVPIYAYDPRFPNVVYIRDSESEQGSIYTQSGLGNGRPSGVYQFHHVKDLCDFQAKLTLEKVVLDITSVKLVKLSKDSKSTDTYYTVRLQMWHEAELRKASQSDVASFLTAGTSLSGPLRERLEPSTSRLIIYLGRLGEYITLFITDDIEVKIDGPTAVKLKPRKASGFSKKGSRWPGIKAHIERKGRFEMAGLEIHGKAMDIDIDSTYSLYKTFEIDFENSPSQDNFVRKWDEVMRERRQQRMRLNQIREEMGQNVFSGQMAREIWL
ncbi:hypothetical protein QBC47DRAFT_182781 [Echria macrotheca]|uniref:Uncharacterized protein n=1 Tax=Echria macrotheca TaxID=438768 RepID=A0AAJ0FAD3_9PEZI|nr:hypothetical protein QBC47DRAFT_182781 [Echria macrotheca]